MLSPERCKQAELMNKEPADKFDKICAESVAAKLASWSVVDRKGNAVACTPANLLKLHPQLWSKLYNIVAGYRPTDALPDEPAAPRLPGGEIQEADSKN